MDSAAQSSLPPSGKGTSKARHPAGRRAHGVRAMEMSVDSQSFVNLGQLMGSRHGGGEGFGLDDLGTSLLSDDDSEGLRDFDQIFHPAWSGRELYSQRGAADHRHEEGGVDGDDDNDSLLPAVPSRSSTPGSPRGDMTSNRPSSAAGWVEDDFDSGAAGVVFRKGAGRVGHATSYDQPATIPEVSGALGNDVAKMETEGALREIHASLLVNDVEDSSRCQTAAGGAGSTKGNIIADVNSVKARPSCEVAAGTDTASATNVCGTPTLRESWLHVPMDEDEDSRPGETEISDTDSDPAAEGGDAARNHQHQRYSDAAVAAARARRAAAHALVECGDCLVHGVEKAAALAKVPLQELGRVVKEQVEAGAGACSRGQQAAVKAIDNVPQAPVRVWLGRIAGSLCFGAILGGMVVFYALRMSGAPSLFNGGRAGGGGPDTTSPWWTTAWGESAGGTAEHTFGDRLNKALFAARAGEAAAQQGLLEEVRNILAATGESGGISAEQILRQFNAKRFKEASKAWSAAEGNIVGSDPLDPLFFAPPTSPVYPSSASSSSPSQQQQQQQQQPFSSVFHEATPATDCAGGAFGSSFCSSDGAGGGGGGESTRAYFAAARAKAFGDGARHQPQYRRTCGGGGWVC